MNDQENMRSLPTASPVVDSRTCPVVDQDTQAFLDEFTQTGGLGPHELGNDLASAKLNAIQRSLISQPITQADDVLIVSQKYGEVNIRIIRPEHSIGPLPIVIYLHGGGWAMGGWQSHGLLATTLAIDSGFAVVFVNYSTMPETRFPTQNEQAYAAICYVVDHATALDLDNTRIAVVGDGAGGNMAAAVSLMTKRRRGPIITLQVLLYPILGVPDGTASYSEFKNGPWVTAEAMRRYIREQFSDHDISQHEALPAGAPFTALEGMPTTLIITAENDVVRDEGEAYARKLIQAGVPVTATRFLGCIHDFMMLEPLADSHATRSAVRQVISMLKAALI